jgi:3-oxoacyl-[acyl-carrier protein] reductase
VGVALAKRLNCVEKPAKNFGQSGQISIRYETGKPSMRTENEFAEKTVLVTGSAQGIGYATAKLFAQQNANLVMLDIQSTVTICADQLAAEYEVGTLGVEANLQDSNAITHCVEKAVEVFGGIDVVANVGGIFPAALFEEESEETASRIMDINYGGTMRVCRAAIPFLREREGAAIVNVTSTAAHLPNLGYASYSASKAAVLGASRALALELAPKVRVNMVAPGPVSSETFNAVLSTSEPLREGLVEQTPLSAIATPKQVAEAIVFLASAERSGITTGQTLHVNGGLYIP